MKLTVLGTAAAEAQPALFCECETCRQARKNGAGRIVAVTGGAAEPSEEALLEADYQIYDFTQFDLSWL